ncbi:MAG: ribonuclease E/G [Alphaproteobacteria bacterium CG11_big_fil_rev_8_21_14_0_20_39_49]|nr:MAG: ribonuclease E/G [Alphaproteobacteria bacterium CG11_big_fil_rev_8_21_14_0_20_39_49]
MPKRILVDATHVEETRVVVLENGRVAEYDSETSVKKQLKGNIYLAKITRVEPSLQSAFVEYGGDKHGFLPFSEIHPDYYDIPVADKKALLESIRSSNSNEEESEDDDEPVKAAKSGGSGNEESSESEVDVVAVEEEQEIKDDKKHDENLYRKYKIQEVIKRNKIVLVQVEKEERGNKGASLTTFISLAGRYCVLMPNSLRRGGVSRRIENREDRKRLKSVLKNLNIPVEKGLIIRTAGAKRAEDELRGDYNYLAGLWNGIIEKTKQSNAPAFIHAEGDIIKRTMRDLYNEKIDEVLIEGKEAFETAKDFIKVVMSGHASRVKQYKNKVPVFTRYKVEEQIAALYNPEVPLDSGGALVINPTEALISIDVNSGRSTGQRSVEETAVSTNIEAAREVARQLRLRDLSGLIVIDFIDMLDLRNKKTVEKVLRDAFEDDRARIQIGRISTFGLLEMSRQRMASSFLEVNTMVCPTCVGAGVVKATESNAVTVLRAVENDVSRSKCKAVGVYVTQDVALYILNNKREPLSKIENKYNVKVFLNVDDTAGANSFYIEKMKGYEDSVPEADTRPVNKQEKPKKISEPQEDNNVEPFPEKKSRRETKREEIQEKKEARIVGADNIFEGLWKKIVE